MSCGPGWKAASASTFSPWITCGRWLGSRWSGVTWTPPSSSPRKRCRYPARAGRRRALVGAGLGVAASMLVLAIGLEIARSIYLSSVPSSVLPADAAASVWDAFVHFLKVGLRVVLVVGLVVAIGAFFTGPSHTAVQTRSAPTSGIDWIRHYGERRGVSTGPVGQWTYLHRKEPSCRGGGPGRPDIRLLGSAHCASRHPDRRPAARRPGPDRADRQAAGRTACGWSSGVVTPRGVIARRRSIRR